MKNNFIDVELTLNTLDIYLVRQSIISALEKYIPDFKGELLDIGCGSMPYKEFILKNSAVTNYLGLDIHNALSYNLDVKPDLFWDGLKMPIKNNSFNCAIATEVLEHCPNPEIVLVEAHRVLKAGGIFFFTVPFIWNLHEVPNDEYRFTPFAMERILKNSGFDLIQIYPSGGWHASLAQMLGLWVMRAPLNSRVRNMLKRIIKQIMKLLIASDKKYKSEFNEGQMISGLYGIAVKN